MNCILVTGFEPFGPHAANPSEQLAKAVDGWRSGDLGARSLILPVDYRQVRGELDPVVLQLDPVAVLHLGLASSRARIALERVGLNVMDEAMPDNAGYQATGEPCVPGGPAAYFSTLPIKDVVAALTAEGVPAYISNTAGTYLCNHTLYSTLHLVHERGLRARVGFMHLPLLPSMVAQSGLDQPSMDLGLMLRAVEVTLTVIASIVA
jgi:pyroglutamyl-peptidase